jgi:adenylosuccinate synthase
MSIDQLIRDLVEEDQFKAKYTSRQRSIFCKNMYAKVSKFIEETNKHYIEHAEQLEREVSDMRTELEEARRELEELREANEVLNQGYKGLIQDILCVFRISFYVFYVYKMWNYMVSDEKSINVTNITSEIPYSNE